ncbi:MAG: DUF3850 domain-containing protein [Gammaproteobacteria bacterium]|nr:DUF3850 domain-containing protein [Gammaproteobacteria bacterium]
MLHQLKIYPVYFKAVEQGIKRFEIRDNSNRGFQKGDLIELIECDPEQSCESADGYELMTGNKLMAEISYVTNYEQKKNFVVFGFTLVSGDKQ